MRYLSRLCVLYSVIVLSACSLLQDLPVEVDVDVEVKPELKELYGDEDDETPAPEYVEEATPLSTDYKEDDADFGEATVDFLALLEGSQNTSGLPEIQVVSVGSERVQGYDVLALAKYCDLYLKAPRMPTVSTLMRTFGNPIPCLLRAIPKGYLTDIQIDLRDATCWRNRVCPAGTPSLTDWGDLRKLALEVNNRIAVPFPQIKVWVSPWLEHDITDGSVVRKGMDVVKAACPTCRLINSPFRGAQISGVPVELHGTKVRAFAVSGDGASSFDGDNIKNDGNDFQHRISGKDQTYAWWNELNLRCTGEKSFTPVHKRTAKPELWQFRMAHKILSTREDEYPKAPKRCKTIVDIKGGNGEINKPTAERYCNGQGDDGRGNKPLLILRKSGTRGQRLNVYSPSGKKVGCFAYYGEFTTPGLHRWYMGNCSKQQGFQLFKQLGFQEWGFADLGGGKCLRFNAIRRQGIYR